MRRSAAWAAGGTHRQPSPIISELPALMRYAQSGKLTFPESALRFVDLDAAQINAALNALER